MKKTLIRFYKEWTGECIAALIVIIACLPLYLPGHITFSDLAIGREATEYLNYVTGVFNEQLGTPTGSIHRVNMDRPSFAVGFILHSGHIF